MKFNYDQFVVNTNASYDDAIEMIVKLTSILSDYIVEDHHAGEYDSGVYGEEADRVINSQLKKLNIGEYFT